MIDEFKKIIENNLPEQVGKVLRERLEKADKDEQTVKQLSLQIQSNEDKIRALTAKIGEYEKLEGIYQALSKREEAVKERERTMNILTLEYQLAAEREKTDFVKQVALGLVRNTEYRKTVYDSKNGPTGFDQYGNQIYSTHTVHVDETKKQE